MWLKLTYMPAKEDREIMAGEGSLNNTLPNSCHTHHRSHQPIKGPAPQTQSTPAIREPKLRA